MGDHLTAALLAMRAGALIGGVLSMLGMLRYVNPVVQFLAAIAFTLVLQERRRCGNLGN